MHNDHRASFIPTTARDSFYAESTYNDYRPATSGTYHGRNQSSSHLATPIETRQPKRLSGYDSVGQGVGHESFGDLGGYEQQQAVAGSRERNERATRRKSRGQEVAVYDDRTSGY